jgi:hypothetical protein
MHRLALAAMGLCLAAGAADAADTAPDKLTPQQLLQQRAAMEKLQRQARLAARKRPSSSIPQMPLPAPAAFPPAMPPESVAIAAPAVIPSPPAAETKPTPQELVQQRAAQEMLQRQMRLAARWQSRHLAPNVYYPGLGFPAQSLPGRVDYDYPFRAAQSLGTVPSFR